MTMTIDISPAAKEKLEAEAAKIGQAPEEYLRTLVEKSLIGPEPENRPSWTAAAGMFEYPLVGEDAQAWVTQTRREENTERAEFAEWKGASARTLQEVWDNNKDAVYKRL